MEVCPRARDPFCPPIGHTEEHYSCWILQGRTLPHLQKHMYKEKTEHFPKACILLVLTDFWKQNSNTINSTLYI